MTQLISWKKRKRSSAYDNEFKNYKLGLEEKISIIIFQDQHKLVNKK